MSCANSGKRGLFPAPISSKSQDLRCKDKGLFLKGIGLRKVFANHGGLNLLAIVLGCLPEKSCDLILLLSLAWECLSQSVHKGLNSVLKRGN